MFGRFHFAWTGLAVVCVLGGAPIAWSDGAGSLDGSGTSSVTVAGESREARVATFRDFLAGQTARQVDRVFRDLLGRSVDAASLGVYRPVLETDGGAALVADVLDSDECALAVVKGWYRQFLLRAASSSEAAPFVDALQSGERDETLLAEIVSSAEYFARRGDGTNAGFLAAVFEDLLGRPIDETSQARFMTLLSFGGTRAQVVEAIVNRREYRNLLVTGYFSQFLGREPASNERAELVSQIENGARFADVIAAIAGSEEYFDRVQAPTYVATVAWGDGTSTPGEVVVNPQGGFEVRGSHTYAEWGSFAIQATVTDGAGSTLVLNSVATVVPAGSNDDDPGDGPSAPRGGDDGGPTSGNDGSTGDDVGNSGGGPSGPTQDGAGGDDLQDELGPPTCGLGASLLIPLALAGLLLTRRAT